MPDPTNPPRTAGVKALLFDTFGTLVDWRTSLIADLSAFGRERGLAGVDWTALVDAWRAAYAPSMDRVRKGELPWTVLDDLHRVSLEKLLAEHRITGLSEHELDHLNRGWHRLHPWADTVAGMQRLRTRYILGPLSNGNVALLVNLARFGRLPFDVIFGSDVFRHFKPDPETYLGACALLRLRPAEVMMVAAHNYDLRSAAALGLKTGFIPRPTEYGPLQNKDFAADGDWDVVASDLVDLAEKTGA
jgi:2-haloacid dehalogenase